MTQQQEDVGREVVAAELLFPGLIDPDEQNMAAWEIDRRLIIQNLASIRSIADDPKQLILQGGDFTRLAMDFYWTPSFLWPEGCDDHFCQLLSPLN